MELKDIIYTRRKELRLTLKQIADACSVSEGTVQRWESGNIENMRRDKIKKLANILKTTPSYIMGWTDDVNDITQYNNIIPLPETELIPLVGTIACGTPTLAEENIEDYVKCGKDVKADFCLRCKGDSMINARIFDGDLVYIRQQDEVENGEIAAVLIGNEATLKRFYKLKNRIELRAENPTFKTIEIEEDEDVRIIGKAVAFLSCVR